MSKHFTLDVDADGIATITWDMPGRSMNVLNPRPRCTAYCRRARDGVVDDGAVKGIIITSGKAELHRRRRPRRCSCAARHAAERGPS